MSVTPASSHCRLISTELNLRPTQVEAATALFGEGATVPFIARYRKEKTGSLDEVALQTIRDRLEQLAELDKRRDSILGSLTERQLLTPELESAVRGASTLAGLEDLYLPYRPKRRTRAQMARERGLEPLANHLLLQEPSLDRSAPPKPISARKRACPARKKPWKGPVTSSPSSSASTRKPARPCAPTSRPSR